MRIMANRTGSEAVEQYKRSCLPVNALEQRRRMSEGDHQLPLSAISPVSAGTANFPADSMQLNRKRLQQQRGDDQESGNGTPTEVGLPSNFPADSMAEVLMNSDA